MEQAASTPAVTDPGSTSRGASARLRSIVVTGASSGLGAELALGWAAPGVTLGLIGRDLDRLRQVASACREAGSRAEAVSLDLRDRVGLAAWLGWLDREAPVDLVVANAGISGSVGPRGEPEPASLVRAQFEVNLLGAVNTIEPLLGPMLRRGSGQVAIIASLAALRGHPSAPAYHGSKAGLLGYGESLRGWLDPLGIRVTVVLPGFFASPMSERYRGTKPFRLTAAEAARRSRDAIERGTALAAFPWPLAWGVRLVSILPPRLGDAVFRRFAFEVDPPVRPVRPPEGAG